MKSKKTKKALTGSVLALVLCFVMLLGTTFAWFTDTASTNVNTIQAGTLDVALEVKESGNWVTAEGKTLNFVKAAGHESEDILWEPGATYELQPVRVVNKGNLALKYKIVISGIEGSAKLNEAIDWTIVSDGAAVSGSTGEYHLSPAVGEQDSYNTITIKGTMRTDAGNEYQNQSITGVTIAVEATQWTEEYDSTTDQYDANATYGDLWDGVTTANPTKKEDGKYHITSAAEFAAFVGGEFAIPAGSTVVLDCDIDLGGATVKGYHNGTFDSDLDGQGHTVSNFTVTTTFRDDEHYCGLFPNIYGGHSVKNLTVKNAMAIAPTGVGMVGIISGAAYENTTVENCHVINCTVVGQKKVGSVLGYTNGTVKACSATNCEVYCGVSEDEVSGGRDHQAGEVVGYTDGEGSVDSTNTYSNVNVYFSSTPAFVSTADDLSDAMHKGGSIILTKDISVDSWTPVRVDTANAYQPITNSISIDGNGHSISGLTSSLLAMNPAQYVEIKNLTIKNSNIVSNESGNNASCGAFAAYVDDYVLSFKMSNCHAVNVNVTANNSDAYGAAALLGVNGMTTGNKVFSIVDCTVTGGSVTNTNGNAAAIVGMCYTNANSAVISGCSVSGVTITGEKTEKQGAIVGTICNGGGTLEIANCTYTGSAYGRAVGATVNVY